MVDTTHYAIAFLKADNGSNLGGYVMITQTEGLPIEFDFTNVTGIPQTAGTV